MTILGLCFDSTSTGATHAHDVGLVALSFLVAAFASYSALDMAERLRASEGRARAFWLVMSGLTLGSGVWSMHFIGMTAYDAPMEQGYAVDPTIASGVIVILAVTGGLWMLGSRPGPARLALAGVVVGLGVAAMHYVGMSALSVPGEIVYRPGLFGLSVLIALTAAIASLWLAANVRKTRHRAVAALVMAIAICGMHYTAMSGTVVIMAPTHGAQEMVVSKGLLAAIVTVGVTCLIVAGLLMAFLDRRMADRNLQEACRLREVNTALELARREAESATRAKSRFLATMSHEIRTPMNGVLGMLEAALRSNLSPVQRDQIATARDSASELLHILNDILDYSKLEANQLILESLDFSPRQCADDIVSMLQGQAHHKGVSLTCQIEPAVPDWIVGDPTRFRQVLTNLVSNAVKFTAAGSVAIGISYSRSGEGDHVRVEVSDTGIGVSEEARSRLFARFSQADASTTRRFGGTGLGLAICRELVDRMGGRIGVASSLGAGSIFWFDLPTRPGAEPEWAGVSLADPDAPVPGSKLAPLHILVAEDNLVNQKVLRALLAPHRHTLTFVGDGARAVDAVRTGAFDLVLMDISMPVMDGPAAARAIRALSVPGARTPIVALTANAMAGDRETYLAAGMNDYVSKPVDIDALLDAIARQTDPGRTRAARAPTQAAVQADAVSDALAATLADISAQLDGVLGASPAVRAA